VDKLNETPEALESPIEGLEVSEVISPRGEVITALSKPSEAVDGKFYTVQQVAEILNFHPRYVSRLCKLGVIKAHKPFGKNYRISPEEYQRISKEGIKLPKKELPKKKVTLTEIVVTPEQEALIRPSKGGKPPLQEEDSPQDSPKKKEEKKEEGNPFWPLPFRLW